MDRILNFAALRPPSQVIPSVPALASSSDFQQELAAAVAGPHLLDDAVAVAQSFVEDGRFLVKADEVNHGVEFLALYERLTDASTRNVADIEAEVREVVGDSHSSDWAEYATRARDSVLAGYLLAGAGPSTATALALVRVYSVIEAVQAGAASQDQIELLLRAPLILPDYLLGLRASNVTDAVPPSPDAAATVLVEQFQSAQERHARLGDTLAHIVSHDEDELVLSELGEQRPLTSLYRTAPTVDGQSTDTDPANQRKPLDVGKFAGSSPLRRFDAPRRGQTSFSPTRPCDFSLNLPAKRCADWAWIRRLPRSARCKAV